MIKIYNSLCEGCCNDDCIDYDISDERRRYEEENLKVDKYLKNFR